MSVDLKRNDSFGFTVSVAGDDGIGAGEIQFDAGDRQPVHRHAVLFLAHELIGVVIIVRLNQQHTIPNHQLYSIHQQFIFETFNNQMIKLT